MAVWLLGWLGDAVALRVAAIVGDTSGWAAVVVFSASFLFTLVAIVVVLRLCGQELGIARPDPARGEHGWRGPRQQPEPVGRRDAALPRPLLGLRSRRPAGRPSRERPVLPRTVSSVGGPTVLSAVRGLAEQHPWWMLGLLLGVYLLRRLTDHLHERSGIGVSRDLTAVVESFFILVVIFGGFVLLPAAEVSGWGNRAFVGWLDAAGRCRGTGPLRGCTCSCPSCWDRFAGFLADPVWPMFWTVVSPAGHLARRRRPRLRLAGPLAGRPLATRQAGRRTRGRGLALRPPR